MSFDSIDSGTIFINQSKGVNLKNFYISSKSASHSKSLDSLIDPRGSPLVINRKLSMGSINSDDNSVVTFGTESNGYQYEEKETIYIPFLAKFLDVFREKFREKSKKLFHKNFKIFMRFYSEELMTNVTNFSEIDIKIYSEFLADIASLQDCFSEDCLGSKIKAIDDKIQNYLIGATF